MTVPRAQKFPVAGLRFRLAHARQDRVGRAVIGSVVGRIILKRTSGSEGVEKVMVGVMPKVMDKAFDKLAPARRQEMLAHFHATLAGLEEKYGTRTKHAEESTE